MCLALHLRVEVVIPQAQRLFAKFACQNALLHRPADITARSEVRVDPPRHVVAALVDHGLKVRILARLRKRPRDPVLRRVNAGIALLLLRHKAWDQPADLVGIRIDARKLLLKNRVQRIARCRLLRRWGANVGRFLRETTHSASPSLA